MTKRLRRDETTADQITEGDLITPPNNYGRARVTRLFQSDNVIEPHVGIGYQYPDDHSVNALHRGQHSGQFYRPGDPITRWI